MCIKFNNSNFFGNTILHALVYFSHAGKKVSEMHFFPYYIYIKDAVRIRVEQLEKEVGKGVLSHRLALHNAEQL